MMLLVKYGEIALKSHSVRRRFEQQLLSNIQKRLVERNIEAALEIQSGVMLIRTKHTSEVEDILSRTFGVVYYSRAAEMSCDPIDMEKEAVRLFENVPGGSTFAVRCKRSGSHPYTSMDMAARLGSAVYESHRGTLEVDLTTPDNVLWVEIRNKKCHMYTQRTKGMGGLPVGTQGRAVLSVPQGMEDDAAVAGWLVLKRGVSLRMFKDEDARDIAPILEPWGGPASCMEHMTMKEALSSSKSLAVVLPHRMPGEKPILPPPAAVLYPLASLPDHIYENVRSILFSVS